MSESELPNKLRQTLAFARIFLEDEDQFPTLQATADRFSVTTQAVVRWYAELAKAGFIERNAVGKYRFTREGEPA